MEIQLLLLQFYEKVEIHVNHKNEVSISESQSGISKLWFLKSHVQNDNLCDYFTFIQNILR